MKQINILNTFFFICLCINFLPLLSQTRLNSFWANKKKEICFCLKTPKLYSNSFSIDLAKYNYIINKHDSYTVLTSYTGIIFKNHKCKQDTIFYDGLTPFFSEQQDSIFNIIGLKGYGFLYHPPSLYTTMPPKEFCPPGNFMRKVVISDTFQKSSLRLKDLKKVQSIYALSIHRNTSDIFCLKLDKSKPDYFRGTYAVLPKVYDALFTLKEIDTLTYGRDYPLFHYQVGQRYLYEEGKYKTVGYWQAPMDSNFLHLVFCPQIGIMSYYFVKANIKIELENIDNKPIRYYVENHICLTHLCEIK